ncbi:hypothetical protein EDD55_10310 [Varunaivibrio sulfuroxidans]|uniref:Uncharacterized protein n=1 Tax=Varunaivibrio sulfuroxidans TaxID=1773489 RepID=A0A4R3JBI5_9PROT|nr:hypothetical protein EDD55_10310 [Varunaivibrio sulfuroxidans]
MGFTSVAVADTLDYTVLRNGAPIGSHVIDISGPDGGQTVKITTKIRVKVVFLTVYHFTHVAEERWRDGRLIALTSNTNDDGVNKSLSAHATPQDIAEHATVKGKEIAYGVPLDTLPASLWREDIVRRTQLINTLDGHVMHIRVTDLGADRLSVRHHDVAAHHYRLKGDLERDLWYDGAQTLVKVRFKGSDGSDIVYALR